MSVKKLCDRCSSNNNVKTYRIEEIESVLPVFIQVELCNVCINKFFAPKKFKPQGYVSI